jgi:hypothetical protein
MLEVPACHTFDHWVAAIPDVQTLAAAILVEEALPFTSLMCLVGFTVRSTPAQHGDVTKQIVADLSDSILYLLV